MPRAADLSLNDREFILQALRQGLRVDNRPFDVYRPLELTLGDEYGVADVRLGKTRFADSNSHKVVVVC
jgi:exosome complex component RRP45